MLKITLSCFADCDIIIILKNGAKEKQRSFVGIYYESSNFDGKPSYKTDDLAIWYNKEANVWFIGKHENLGSLKGGIFAVDEFGGLTDEKNVWKYWNGDEWKTAGSNEITVGCESGNSQFLLNSIKYLA